MARIDIVSDFDYQFSRSLRGVPSNPHRVVRATPDCWKRGLSRSRAIGTAVDENNDPVYAPDGGPTVKVIKDGITTYVPASNYRPTRRLSTRQAATVQRHHMTAADMAPVQDYENDN